MRNAEFSFLFALVIIKKFWFSDELSLVRDDPLLGSSLVCPFMDDKFARLCTSSFQDDLDSSLEGVTVYPA
jgi:hypothetical protein